MSTKTAKPTKQEFINTLLIVSGKDFTDEQLTQAFKIYVETYNQKSVMSLLEFSDLIDLLKEA